MTGSDQACLTCRTCAEAAARAERSGAIYVCECDAVHVPSGRRSAVRIEPRAGLDLAVGEVPAPKRQALRLVDESAVVVRVRGLLCELRPETSGPLGWGPYDLPPDDVAKITPPVRVQNGSTARDIPAGAFQRTPLDLVGQVRRRIDAVAAVDPLAASVLVHLQRRGTLKHGHGALCVGVAHACADGARVAKWAADTERAWERAKVWGASKVDAAADAWDRTAGGLTRVG